MREDVSYWKYFRARNTYEWKLVCQFHYLSFSARIHVEFLSLHDNTKFNRYCVHDTRQLDYENVHCLPVNNTRWRVRKQLLMILSHLLCQPT